MYQFLRQTHGLSVLPNNFEASRGNDFAGRQKIGVMERFATGLGMHEAFVSMMQKSVSGNRTYRKKSGLFMFLSHQKEPVNRQPIQNSLDPFIILWNSTVADECSKLVDYPNPSSVDHFNLWPVKVYFQ